jgi:hypothetical protein
MKRLFVVTLLVTAMSACTRTQVSAPEESAAGNTVGSLAKESSCSVSYGPSKFSLNDLASANWPPAAPNLTIWYFGGIYPNDPLVHDFIAGFGVLDGSSDCWSGQPFTIRLTLRKRGADAANVSPALSVYSVDTGQLLVRFPTTTSFVTLESGVLAAGSRQLRLIFHPGDINLSGKHVDVNIDVSSVMVSTVE